jgi:hypothetical protein
MEACGRARARKFNAAQETDMFHCRCYFVCEIDAARTGMSAPFSVRRRRNTTHSYRLFPAALTAVSERFTSYPPITRKITFSGCGKRAST